MKYALAVMSSHLEASDILRWRAEALLMYPADFSVGTEDDSMESQLLRKARDQYQVKLMPVTVQSRVGGDRK